MKSERSSHRQLLVLTAALALSAAVPHAFSVEEATFLPLPSWTQEDASQLRHEPQSVPLGGFLWPDGFNADSLVPPETPSARIPPEGFLKDGIMQGQSAGRSEGFLLFIPKRSAFSTASNQATPPHGLVEVGSDFLTACEALQPSGCLDPHALLPEIPSEDLQRLLAYHAGEASTFAHFLILDAHEELPPSPNLSRIAQGRVVQDHGCLAVYPLGEPWRARIFMTEEIATKVAPTYLRSILQACAQDALQASDPVEQLQRFATQLSIRLIWMERAHPEIFAPEEVRDAMLPKPETTLAEITQGGRLAPAPTQSATRWGLIASIAAGSLVAIVALIFAIRALNRWRTRRLRNSVWMLPEVEVKPRYGAPHCGQGGAWIRYG